MQLYPPPPPIPHPHDIITGCWGQNRKTKLNENKCSDILSGLSRYKETFRNICLNAFWFLNLH